MEIIEGKQNGNVLELCIFGKIDSQNAPEFERRTNEICDTISHDSVVIDAQELLYISSAGLRVLLHVAKKENNLKIINASPEVYEIFDMTGFTNIVKVQRAYKNYSIDGCEILGRGANGTVYRYSPEIAIKVYNNVNALDDIHRERELAKKAFVMGIPTAISFDVAKVGDTYGSVFELLNAKSFSKLLAAEPQNFERYVGKFVDVLKIVHSTEADDDIPDMLEYALTWPDILQDHLDESTCERLREMFDTIPKSNHLIHGDYHTDNVVMQGDEVLLIDMDTLSSGDPILEFSQMYNGFVAFGEYDERKITDFLGISIDMASEVFYRALELYFGDIGDDAMRDIQNKIKLVAYARFMRRAVEKLDITSGEGKWMYENSRRRIEELLSVVDDLVL